MADNALRDALSHYGKALDRFQNIQVRIQSFACGFVGDDDPQDLVDRFLHLKAELVEAERFLAGLGQPNPSNPPTDAQIGGT